MVRDSQEGSVICQADIGPGGSQVSFNPLNWKHLCLIGPTRICFYSMEQCDTDYVLSPLYVRIITTLILVIIMMFSVGKLIFQTG